MKLHNDRDAFEAIIAAVSRSAGYRSDVVEKDYYVSLLLWELAKMQGDLPAYFKGGTALYKALKTVRRFSEDIDLTVAADDCCKSQAKRRLERASSGYQSLNRTADKTLESNGKGSITCVYDYATICGIQADDALQRFGHVKVEATSFTVSEPFEAIEIEPLLYTKATDEQRRILRDSYDVAPFEVNTIKAERIFADKIFASEFYYQRSMYFDVAKHLYDIVVLMALPKIKALLGDGPELARMIAYKRREETVRIGSDLSDKAFADFEIFADLRDNRELKIKFGEMQSIYVFDEHDRIDYGAVCDSAAKLYNVLIKLSE